MDIITLLILVVVIIALVVAYSLGRSIGKKEQNNLWKEKEPQIREDAASRSRAVLSGQFSEQLAPYLPNFNYAPTECKFIGKPVDFIVFKGLDEKNVSEIVFVEVKSGKSNLSSTQKSVKKAVDEKRIKWEEYRALKK